ncbi:MAG: peptide-methionine (S)-S-oxide reductase MsrA [Trueperaceae bacterium]|nr:peptide-methionine (S)-S-oxide reductase MsrA [Trueperaceae bacterium]
MDENQSTRATATLGGGCFWCLDAVYRHVEGVTNVTSGYAGGHVENPTYQQVCTGRTGHAEVVQVEFDPSVVSYRDLLGIFFSVHDPTTKDRQGADVGPQYRSLVLAEDDAQERTAYDVIAEVEREGVWDAPIVTDVARLTAFYPAEPYHQNFFTNYPEQAYCAAVIAPKVAQFRHRFADRLKTA